MAILVLFEHLRRNIREAGGNMTNSPCRVELA
jgi:hypothetical protein